jgi:hypothetical protein
MKASIKTNTVTNEVTITIEGLHWDALGQGAFYEGEVQVQALLQLIGQELTVHLLRRKAVDSPTLDWEGQTYYRKAASPGYYHTLYGEIVISRYLYQSSAGGATLCPLEINCQLRFGSATPLLAEVVSFKLASAPAGDVAQDLAKSHSLSLSETYLRHLAQQVGQLAVDKHAAWHLRAAAAPASVALIATGVDHPGATSPGAEPGVRRGAGAADAGPGASERLGRRRVCHRRGRSRVV